MLIWKIFVTKSFGVSMMGFGFPMPALLIKILGSPHFDRSCCDASLIEDGSVTSHLKNATLESVDNKVSELQTPYSYGPLTALELFRQGLNVEHRDFDAFLLQLLDHV